MGGRGRGGQTRRAGISAEGLGVRDSVDCGCGGLVWVVRKELGDQHAALVLSPSVRDSVCSPEHNS